MSVQIPPTLQFVPGDGRGARPAPQHFGELSPAAEALARLVPSVYHSRNDAVPGRPLLSLLDVVADQFNALERAATALLDDRFVERASPLALRLLADLVGAKLTGDDPRTHRAVVARTLHWRRRKGTLATLEDVLAKTGGWPAEVDEAYRSLLLDQDLARLQPWRGRTAVLWDPITLADPLTRRARGNRSARDPEPGLELVRRPDEDVEQTLRRVGAVDAGRYAASPRTVDLLGWARPDRVVIRTDRMVTAELDGVELGDPLVVTHRGDPSIELRGYALDPRGRDLPLVGRYPVQPGDELALLTSAHEPAAIAPVRSFRDGVLTPTGLAGDAAGLEAADTLSVFVDGVRLVGQHDVLAAGNALAFEPVGPAPTLRFADASRPTAGETWELRAYALEPSGPVATAVLPDVPPPGDDSPMLLSTRTRHRDRDAVDVRPAARVRRAGAEVALRVARVAGADVGHHRDAEGTWSPLTTGPRLGPVLSNVALVEALPAGPTLVRLERNATGCAVARWVPGDVTSRWSSVELDLSGLSDADLPDVDPPVSGPALAVTGRGDAVVLVAPVRDDAGRTPGLGLWRIGGLDGAMTIERLDAASSRHPSDRVAACVVVDGDRLVLHGGQRSGRVLSDTWSVTLGPGGAANVGSWRSHAVRRRVPRVGGTLVVSPAGLVLVGGAGTRGELAAGVHRLDLSRARPFWERLQDLPVPVGAPGVVVARADATASGAGVELLAWLDSVRPVRLRSDAARGWRAGAPEGDAPNPPADGEALFVGDELVIAGPSPLPPSEIVVTIGGTGHLAFLPALDPAPDEAVVVTLADDGSTQRWLPPGQPVVDELRLGAGRAAPSAHRNAPADRIGVPGRLAWLPLRLRQVSLGPWEQPVALDLPDAVGVDPRLGRLLIRAEVADGAVSATIRVGRPAAIGAGFAPPDGAVPAAWADPDSDLAIELPPTVAWVAPARAGLDSPTGTELRSRLGEALADALTARSEDAPVAIAVLGSPRLPPDLLIADQRAVVAVVAADPGTRPYVEADDGVSLGLHEQLTGLGGEDPDEGPSWMLRGLTLAGAVRLAISAGRLDVRWCSIAAPGEVAVRVAGAGHAPDLVRYSLPRARVAVRLVGCELGVLEVPPWTDVVAVGCTFDAGASDAVAIAAGGAGVRLRHCTVQGRTVTGTLRASSSAFRGSVVCDRPDLGWLRYCVTPGTGRQPLSYRGVTAPLSFSSARPTDPDYLRLDENNPGVVLRAAERTRTPGAHHEFADRTRELDVRTDEFLPLALAPFHVDHAVADLVRTRRLR